MSQQINLFNPLFLKQKKYFSSVAMVQALALLALGIGLAHGFISFQGAELVRRAEEVGRMHAAQQQRFNKFSAELSPDAAVQAMDRDMKDVEAQIAARRALLQQLQAGGEEATTGYSMFLSAFARQTLNGLWLTAIQVAPGGGQLTVRGRATQAELLPAYIRQLGREPALKGRAFERLELTRLETAAAVAEKPASGLVEFSLMAPVDAGDGAVRPPQGQVN